MMMMRSMNRGLLFFKRRRRWVRSQLLLRLFPWGAVVVPVHETGKATSMMIMIQVVSRRAYYITLLPSLPPLLLLLGGISYLYHMHSSCTMYLSFMDIFIKLPACPGGNPRIQSPHMLYVSLKWRSKRRSKWMSRLPQPQLSYSKVTTMGIPSVAGWGNRYPTNTKYQPSHQPQKPPAQSEVPVLPIAGSNYY